MLLLDDILDGPGLGTAFQPIVDLARRQVVGHEALARYASDSPLARPDLLFRYAARKHRVTDLELACVRSSLHNGRRLAAGSLLFFNMHPDVLRLGPPFADFIEHEAEAAGIPLGHLVLELTEQASITDTAAVFDLIARLRSNGTKIAFDDVGIAYSHLTFMDRIRPEYLKISQDFGTAFHTDPTRTKLVRNLVALAQDFNCTVVLEGIEDAETAESARDLGVQLGQGYLFGRPSPATASD